MGDAAFGDGALGAAGRHRAPTPPVLALPSALQRARVAVARPAVWGLAAAVVAAALVFGVRVVWAQEAAQPEVVAPGPEGAFPSGPVSVVRRTAPPAGTTTGPGSGVPAAGAGGLTPGAAADGVVTVHVVGQVRRPGLVRLAAGARVADAVRQAGGATDRADLAALNLARLLVDGEQIRVPRPGEAPAEAVVGPSGGAAPSSGLAGPSGAAGGLVNLNTADLATLESLPGVGPVLAQRIVDWRTEHGRFTTVDELNEVSGIGEKLMAQIAPKVSV